MMLICVMLQEVQQTQVYWVIDMFTALCVSRMFCPTNSYDLLDAIFLKS